VKIVFAGLDNAGKTSFLIALRKKYNFFETVEKLKPTVKIDYQRFDLLGEKIDIWDMGGQKKYREMYVNKKYYFEETNYLYYIIDIQDEFRLNSSVNYLYEILNIYREIDYENEVIICFHKYDPQFLETEQFNERVQMVKNLILNQNNDFHFKFFKTSYYNISSLSKAFSYSLNDILDLGGINQKFKKFLEDFKALYILLFTDTGMILVDQYREILDPKKFEEKIRNRIDNNLEFFQRLKDEEVQMNERLVLLDEHFEFMKRFHYSINSNSLDLYIGTFGSQKKLNEIKDEVNKFKSILKETIFD
jgi:small GTP-binding protein